MPEAKQEVGGKPYTCQYDFRRDIRSEFVKETTSGQRHAGYSVLRVTQEMSDAIMVEYCNIFAKFPCNYVV